MKSAYAHSSTSHEGEETSAGLSERPIPLLTTQEILQLEDIETLSFHRRLPPMRITRMDWRKHPALIQRRNIPAPQLDTLPQIADIPMGQALTRTFRDTDEYVDPDKMGDILPATALPPHSRYLMENPSVIYNRLCFPPGIEKIRHSPLLLRKHPPCRIFAIVVRTRSDGFILETRRGGDASPSSLRFIRKDAQTLTPLLSVPWISLKLTNYGRSKF